MAEGQSHGYGLDRQQTGSLRCRFPTCEVVGTLAYAVGSWQRWGLALSPQATATLSWVEMTNDEGLMTNECPMNRIGLVSPGFRGVLACRLVIEDSVIRR